MKSFKYLICALPLLWTSVEAQASDRVSRITGYEPKAGEMYFKFALSGALPNVSSTTFVNGNQQKFFTDGNKVNDLAAYGVQGIFNYRVSENFSIEGGIGALRSQGGKITYVDSETKAPILDSQDNQLADAGNLIMLPIHISANYHFGPYGQLDPYVGAGVHYTYMTNNFSKISHGEGGGGPLVKGGVNIKVNKLYSFFIEVEHKFLSSETDYNELFANLYDLDVGPSITQDVTYDPTTVSVGIGLKF